MSIINHYLLKINMIIMCIYFKILIMIYHKSNEIIYGNKYTFFVFKYSLKIKNK